MAVALALLAGAAAAQTFNGSTTNTAGNSLIPSAGTGTCGVLPQSTGGTIFNNAVAGLAAGALVQSVQINLTHTFDNDLDIFLRAPNGQMLELTSDNGGSGDNYTNTVFQTGSPSITGGVAPFTGTFAPEGTLTASCDGVVGTIAALGAFTAAQNGTWQLVIQDDLGGDTGTMLAWSITFLAPTGCTVTLTCPADQVAAAPPGASSTVVTFPAPVVGGTCTAVTVACVPASGDAFPVGTSNVVCTGTDASGASATCNFDVTVGNQTLQEIPTASTLGLAALALLLAGAAFVALRRG